MNLDNLSFSVSVGTALTDDEKHIEAFVCVMDNDTHLRVDIPITEYDDPNIYLDPSKPLDRAAAHRMLDRWLDMIAAIPVKV